MPDSPRGPAHSFFAAAFVENLPLKELAAAYPEARRSARELWFAPAGGGSVFIYPFGAVVFLDVGPEARAAELARLAAARPGLTKAQVLNEELSVRESSGARPDLEEGVLVVDSLSFERASVVALTVAQSAAMDYYERIVDQMFVDADRLGNDLEKAGTMPMRTRHLHKFIGATVGTRNEVLSILHLLDMPDAAWDDPGTERIYQKLRAEFDLVDRYHSLELKLRSVQDTLEVITDVARDRRLFLLEAAIVMLIVFEIVLSLVRH
jgi:required for meiotic nuclear division protein 1